MLRSCSDLDLLERFFGFWIPNKWILVVKTKTSWNILVQMNKIFDKALFCFFFWGGGGEFSTMGHQKIAPPKTKIYVCVARRNWWVVFTWQIPHIHKEVLFFWINPLGFLDVFGGSNLCKIHLSRTSSRKKTIQKTKSQRISSSIGVGKCPQGKKHVNNYHPPPNHPTILEIATAHSSSSRSYFPEKKKCPFSSDRQNMLDEWFK